ncbi:hypothetical protein ACP4OV_002075 [Aristida adscensionis]
MELVVGASEATMKSLLGKLGGLLAQEYTLIRGVRGDIQYITDELSSMQAFLRDLSTAPDGQDNRMKDWMKQIRDIAYDCEDCIDDFAHRLPDDSISDVRCSFVARRLNEVWTWWPRREIAANIADLKVRAQQIAERRSRYGVNNPGGGNSGGSGARAATYDIAEHQLASHQLIGMKEPVGMMTDMENLEKWVNKPDEERAVLSIVGFGGVGKTTIATALYRKVSNVFDCRASVTVSQNYDQDAVLRSILNQVMPQDRIQEQHGSRTESLDEKSLVAQIRSKFKQAVPLTRVRSLRGNGRSADTKQIKTETMDHDQLIEELKRRLVEKRYLLLIDDIWSAKTWESIRICLPENNKGSRIIVTTRFQAVGATCSQRDRIDLLHTIDFLSVDDSKRLFDQSVSESRSSRHGEKVQDQVPEEIWKICGGLPLAIVTIAGLVACNPSRSEVCRSLFPEPVDRLTLDGVTRILDYCYNDLPGDLKTCSLYMSIFPKGWKISRKRLTRRWIAEGFVSEKQGLTEEEVAETYFNQLMRRKIIRPVEHCSNGKSNGWKGLKEKHLNDICKMLVLKYLSLRRTEISKIPSNVEKLEYLETLDIRETNVEELPRSVGQLKRISSILGGNKNSRKGLRLPEEKGKDPRKSMLPQEKGRDGMKALRILSGIEIVGESTAVAGLHQLTGLRKLAIYKLIIQKDGDTFKELRSSIEYLCSCGLQTLAISDEGSDFINSLDSMSAPPRYLIALELSGKLERPPQWITKLHTLNKLTLSVTVLRTDTFELLCTLSSLFSLTFSQSALKQDQDIEDILEKNKSQSDGEIFVPSGFPRLKLLRFFAPLVSKLGFSDNAMPALEIIEMRFEAFEGLLGIDTLEELQEVHLRVNDQTDEITKILVDDLKNNSYGLKVIVDFVVTA